MSRNRTLLALAIATALGAAVLLLAGDGLVWLRVVLGIPFALLLPGQAVMLFVDSEGNVSGFELATIALAATVGVATGGVVAAIAAVTMLSLVAAALRAGNEPSRRPQASRRDLAHGAWLGALALLGCTAAVLLLSIPGLSGSRSAQVVQLWGLPDTADGSLRIGVNNVDATSLHYTLKIEQGGRLVSVQQLVLPAGKDRLFIVKRSALWTASEPVAAVLTDSSGAVATRSISVWTTP
jgi:hypothetical protein